MRFHRITFVSGLAIGYVLGAQAGRERYDQLRRLARKAAESPAMQQTAGAIQAQASATARSARTRAATGMRKGTAKVAGHRPAPARGGTAARAARTGTAARAARTGTAARAARTGTAARASRASTATRATRAPSGGDGASPGAMRSRGMTPPEGGGNRPHRPFVPVDGGLSDHDLIG